MKTPKILFHLALLLSVQIAESQIVHPDDGFVFDDSDVPRIDITIVPANLDKLYADPTSNQEYKTLFRFTRNTVVEDLADVGIRFKGNLSRSKQKLSFRLSFNTFEEGRDFHGLEKMNLNAETNDPSLIRSKLSWELFRFMGVPCSRSNHILLYINDDFYGVYVNIEHIDEKFVRSRFGTNDGNLYKCLWPADLAFRGEDQDQYKFEESGRRAYELQINDDIDDYEDLAILISTLEKLEGGMLKQELEKVLNVQQYLKVMAVDVMTGNWDGYIGNQNNFWLYRDQVTGRFEYLPFDLDNTFGIDWLGEDWSNRSLYSWHRGEKPLYEKILQIEEYKEQFTGYIKILAAHLSSDGLSQEMERWKSQISPHVNLDPYYPLDYAYEFSDFSNAFTSAWGGHVPFGIQEYIDLRVASALEECINADAPPLISHARAEASPGRVDVDWVAEDDNPGWTTTLFYRIDQSAWESIVPASPAETDPVSGLETYRDSLFIWGDTSVVDLYFVAEDQSGQLSQYPSAYLTFNFPLANGPLLINEFMASNSSARSDEFGEFDDWAEIYNPTDSAIWLGDLFLSDNVGNPGKYRFPDEYIDSEGYFLVWLDDQEEQGPHHADFKISKGGEKLRLSDRPSRGFTILDSLTFGEQLTDVSMGRSTDGGSKWIAFYQSTPGFSNLSTGMDLPGESLTLVLYPNPVYDGFIRFNREVSGSIYNTMGQMVLDLDRTEIAFIESFAPGIYIFRTREGESLQFVVAGR